MDNWKKYFTNFELFWKPATRLRIHGRASGGCVYGFRKNVKNSNIKHYYHFVNETAILCIEINSIKFKIIPVYIRGADWHNEFTVLKNYFINNAVDNIILVGDMNVRLGRLQQELEDFHKSSFTAGLEERNSKDHTANDKGRKLIDFCNDFGLVILNGRTNGDENGEFTFLSAVGDSVNDICAVSHNLLQFIDTFQVEAKVWSDHMPLKLKLSIESANQEDKTLNLLPKLVWKDTQKEKYQENLNRNLGLLQTQGEFMNLQQLVDVIKKSVPNQNQTRINKSIFKTKWFNYKCFRARKKSFDLLNEFRKTNNQDDKYRYIQAKQHYVSQCRKRKEEYYEEINNKINKINDTKQWWKLAREIRGDSFKIGTSIPAEDFKHYFNMLLNQPQFSKDIQYAPMWNTDFDVDKAITIQEIKTALNKTKPNKAPGEDRVPYEMIRYATDEFLNELANTFNIILETGKADKVFESSIIFPIHKKGDLNCTNNYRGISFMNCGAKLLMGIINTRLANWIEQYSILNEFQAGFRPNYSTVDNIYNLSAIVHAKVKEKKKIYAFFVDFKAAFDKVPRKPLIYKLHRMGMSTKVVNLIEHIYNDTKSAVWTGNDLSEYFETYTGVKQGCLLSPLLFTLYLNDLHEHLGGGLVLNDINVRLLLYADDIVLLADDIVVMQNMVNNLESYCDQWNMEVNMLKSEMMVFRKSGKLSTRDKILYKNQEVRTVNEYNYLGVILTPTLSFKKHVEKRNISAKNSINATWSSFMNKPNITLKVKWKLFQAVCRSIQAYAAQVWGYCLYDEVDKLQRYFMKRILKLPEFTPNYALALETKAECSYFYTLDLHMNYIYKTLFQYKQNRLPHKLSLIMLQNNLFWAKEINEMGREFGISFEFEDILARQWAQKGTLLLQELKSKTLEDMKQRALNSISRFYKNLDHNLPVNYIDKIKNQRQLAIIFKTRSDLLPLNANKFNTTENKSCTLCNTREDENLQHFMSKCPILREFRIRYFEKPYLNETELINILNGKIPNGWNRIYNYVENALKYRKIIIEEFV